MFYKPLENVLAQRNEATEGARKKAAEALDRAQAKAAAYEEQIRAARNEIYREQEEVRRKWRDEQARQLVTARQRAEAAVAEARARIAGEAADAKTSLAANSQSLADQITQAILKRRPFEEPSRNRPAGRNARVRSGTPCRQRACRRCHRARAGRSPTSTSPEQRHAQRGKAR